VENERIIPWRELSYETESVVGLRPEELTELMKGESEDSDSDGCVSFVEHRRNDVVTYFQI